MTVCDLVFALDKHGQNRTRAAKELGISVRTVYHWINRYRVASEAKKGRPCKNISKS